MNARNIFSFRGCLFIVILALSACEFPTTLPTCDAGETPLYRITSPALFSVIDDLTPTISWVSDDATCTPARFDLEIYSVKNYFPGASGGYFVAGGSSTTDSFTWPTGSPSLEPGNTYLIAFTYVTMLDGEEVGYTSQWSYFSTGPICSDDEEMLAPSLRWPPDGWSVEPPAFELEWDNDMTCWPSDYFFIEISKWSDFHDPIIQIQYSQGEIFWPRRDTPWEDCTTYFWHVRPNMAEMEGEPWSETWSFYTQPAGILCPPDLGLPSIPPEVLLTPRVRLLTDANCRSGPTTEYPLLSILPSESEYEIQMRNRAGDSYMVFDPAINDTCWVYAGLVDVIGDIESVELGDPDPPPAASTRPTEGSASVDCSQWSADQPACIANPACKWDPNLHPSSPCVNK